VSRAAAAKAAAHARVTRAHAAWEAVSAHAAAHVRSQLAAPKAKLDPEAHMPGTASVIWLNRALPDPTPPAKRLTDDFAARLAATSKAAHVGWPLVLGVLRAEGANGSNPANEVTLRRLAGRLAAAKRGGRSDWEAVAAFTGDSALADRAVALSHYDRAVGLWALVHGLEAAKGAMTARLLADPRADIYPGGRDDLKYGKVDVRVIAAISYLADTFGQVTVSCLVAGHRLYARPGVISAHIYGHAVDIAALGGTSIAGHQEPGGLTEHGVRAILLLPSELQPRQVISLLGLGGPSFPLADHADHIHVGY
jgi:hypothetical protein